MSSNQTPWQVEPCTFAEVRGFASRAAREHVKVDCPEGTQYFCVRNASQPIRQNAAGVVTVVERTDNRLLETDVLGFAAIMLRGGAARFKADYVRPEHRDRGIGKALMAARLASLKAGGITRATAFCTSLSLPIYVANGFMKVRVNPRGITFVEAKF